MIIKHVAVLALTLAMLGIANANTTMRWQSAPTDLKHSNYYIWKISFDVANGGLITGGSLSIDQLYNWDARDNILYFHLLGRGDLGSFSFNDDGIYIGVDNPSYGNYIARFGGLEIDTYVDYDGTRTTENCTYEFSEEAVSLLNGSIVDGIVEFGLGFDSDCHMFYSDLTCQVSNNVPNAIPAPSAIFLGGIGVILFGWLRKRRTL